MRGECPVHWTESFEASTRGGRLLVGHDRRGRARGQPRLGDLLLGTRRRHRVAERSSRSSSRGRCSSAWTRPSTTASRRCSSAASRRSGSPTTRTRSARSSRDVLDRLDGPRDVRPRQPTSPSRSSSRVIGSFMGISEEDDAIWARLMNSTLGAGDPDLNPDGVEGVRRQGHPGDLRALPEADRRAPRAPDRRSDERARPRRGRRREARGARDRDGLLPADGGRQRLAPRRPTAAGCGR